MQPLFISSDKDEKSLSSVYKLVTVDCSDICRELDVHIFGPVDDHLQ